jgi:nitrite reductase/ring-hydroxylating ferredoxin subunit
MSYKHKINISEYPLNRTIFIEDEINPILIILNKKDENCSVKVFSANCPHQGGDLNKGKIEGGFISCPWHGCKFDIETGKGIAKLSLIELGVHIEEGVLYVL